MTAHHGADGRPPPVGARPPLSGGPAGDVTDPADPPEAGALPPAHRVPSQFTTNTRRLLNHLAVAGTVPADVLIAGVGLSPEDFDDACRALLSAGLVILTANGAVTFSDDGVRAEVRASLLPGERQALHAAAADALLSADRSRDPTWSTALSEHLHACGRHVDALPHTVRAARRAAARGDLAGADAHFELVRRWWPTGPGASVPTGVTWIDILLESADVARLTGDPHAALALVREAARPDRTHTQAARMAMTEARAWLAAGGPEEATAALQRARSAAAGEGVEIRTAVLAAVAQVELLQGHSEQARAAAEEAVALADAVPPTPEGVVSDDPIGRHRLHAVITAAAADAQSGAATAALDRLRDCLPEVRRSDDLELILRAYGNLSYVFGVSGRHDESARTAAEGLRVSRRHGAVASLLTNLRNNLVVALVTVGRWDAARTAAREALAEVSSPGVALFLWLRLAEVAVARGDPAGADEALGAADALGVTDPYATAGRDRIVVDRLLQDGDPEAAARLARRVVDTLAARQDHIPLLRACWSALRATADRTAAAGPRTTAAAVLRERDAVLQQARAAADRSRLDIAEVLLDTCVAEAGRVTAADTAAQWTTAADGWAGQREPLAEAYCRYRLAAERLREQARAAATAALADARVIVDRLGAGGLRADLDRLATVGDLAPLPEPPASLPSRLERFRLTAREQQVLALLTTGATNRRISRQLGISERTAGVHVSNIINKLGVTNRTEAARMALDRPTGPVDSLGG